MLQLRTHPNGVTWLASPLLEAIGVPHAFSTRLGGVSSGAFAWLNLGNPQGQVRDSTENIMANYNRLFEACGLRDRKLCQAHQVHGRDVIQLRPGDVPADHISADGLMSDRADFALSIRTADCVPILLASDDARVVAALHAGWRGVVAGILSRAIELFAQMNYPAPRLRIAIGPCIGGEAFEVGEEVAEQFRLVVGDAVAISHRPGEKPHVDLSETLLRQAQAHGVPLGLVERTDLCTFRDEKLFFSHRRDRGMTGRLAAIIAPRA